MAIMLVIANCIRHKKFQISHIFIFPHYKNILPTPPRHNIIT